MRRRASPTEGEHARASATRNAARRRSAQRSRIGVAGRSRASSSPWWRSFRRKGIDCSKEIEGARLLAQLGVHAINVPDSPRASARMSAQSLCIQIQQHTGIETILHYTCRDRNMLSIQSDLLGASSIGLQNILCLTGDPPKLGNYPDATAVFDVDAIGLVNIVRQLNHGLDIGANSIGASHRLHHRRRGQSRRARHRARSAPLRLQGGGRRRVRHHPAGLRPAPARRISSSRIEDFRIPVIAGIWPLTSLRNAEFMKNDLRVSMPEEIMLRMAQADTPEAARREGIRIAQEMLDAVRPMVQGVQVARRSGATTRPPK